MDLTQNEFYKEIRELAFNKGYTMQLETLDIERKGERALGSHYVDYENKLIIISLPPNHVEIESIFVHELIHAEMFLTGFPRILRNQEVQCSEIDDHLATDIENMAQHSLLYPRMKALGYNHEEENKKFLESVKREICVPSKGPAIIKDAFLVLEADYRDDGFKLIEPLIQKGNPEVYGLYRRFKRIYNNIDTPLKMRTAILKVVEEIENRAKKDTGEGWNFNLKFNIPPIFTEYEKEQMCSMYYQVIRLQGCRHLYVIDKRDNQCCYLIDGNKHSYLDIENRLKTSKVKEFFR